MKKVYITGIGRDKPGIVAALTQVLARQGGNIEDSTMTILGNRFACIMIGAFPNTCPLEALLQEYAAVEKNLGVSVFVKELEEEESVQPVAYEEEPYIISVAGNDRTGITFEITRILAKYEVNITDLNAHRIAGEEGPVYIMMVETLMPKALNRELFERELAMMGENLNVEVTYHPVENVAL